MEGNAFPPYCPLVISHIKTGTLNFFDLLDFALLFLMQHYVRKLNNLQYSMIRATIPSSFLRFVLILKCYVLENITVLISEKCPYL